MQECRNVRNDRSFLQNFGEIYASILRSLSHTGSDDSPLLLKLEEINLHYQCQRRSEDIQQRFNPIYRPALNLTSNVQRFNDRVLSFMFEQAASLHNTTKHQLTCLFNSTAQQAANIKEIWQIGTKTQKQILSRAQDQARLLSNQIPQRKKVDTIKSD